MRRRTVAGLVASVSVAGPFERIEAHRPRLEALVRSAGEHISRLIGYGDGYPPGKN